MTTPQSPCISNCCLTDNNICSGCFRSLDEIKAWSQASDPTKNIILINAQQRASEVEKFDH